MGALPFVMMDAGRCPVPTVYALYPGIWELLSTNNHRWVISTWKGRVKLQKPEA